VVQLCDVQVIARPVEVTPEAPSGSQNDPAVTTPELVVGGAIVAIVGEVGATVGRVVATAVVGGTGVTAVVEGLAVVVGALAVVAGGVVFVVPPFELLEQPDQWQDHRNGQCPFEGSRSHGTASRPSSTAALLNSSVT
jgi:hypothetical protein